MTTMIVDELGKIPMSPFLKATLARAAEYAKAQSHREVTLEHLLLALAEDPEASVVLKSSNVDIGRLMSDVSAYLGRSDDRIDPATQSAAGTISADLKRILEAAAAAAQQGRRREINGAIVLAAIVGDGKTPSAHLLRSQGLTFEEAIRALQKAATTARPTTGGTGANVAPQGGTPRATTADDVIASARERVLMRQQSGIPGEATMPALEAPPAPKTEPVGERMREANAPATPSGQPLPVEPQWRPARPQPGSPPPDLSQRDRRPEPHRAEGRGSPPTQTFGLPSGPPAAGAPPLAPHTGRPPPMPSNAGPRPPVGAGPPGVPPSRERTNRAPGSPSSAQPVPWSGGGPQQGVPSAPYDEALARLEARRPQSAPPPPAGRMTAGPVGGGRAAVDLGQLVENIPRRMRVGIPVIVEVLIAKAEVKNLAARLQSGGAAYRHELAITRAMTVRLRAPDGGFTIETTSPETQWIENVLNLADNDSARWRWTVTARRRGKKRLQLVVSARTVDAEGLAAETALPDRIFDVRVRINYAQTFLRWGGWGVAAIMGGLLARFGEQVVDQGRELINRILIG